MVSSPESVHRARQDMLAPLDFRAPPPSPVAASRRSSSVANDEVLSEFLHHSLRVPDLVLPDRLFPKLFHRIAAEDKAVPTVDFRSLGSAPEVVKDALERTGCFQLVNHGVAGEMVREAGLAAAGVFKLPVEKKKAAVRSPEMGYGFEETAGELEEEVEMCEEFVWCNEDELKLKMEGIWPTGYSNFSDKMQRLSSAIEDVSRAILSALTKGADKDQAAVAQGPDSNTPSPSVCCIYKHPFDVAADQCISSLRYEVIRLMIRGSDHPHALGLYVCGEGCSEFHVYSKKGWVSFTPAQNALVVTAGDQIQEWSGGQYKHVIGRPIYSSEKQQNSISMAFLCSNSTKGNQQKQEEEDGKIITLQQQAVFAVLFTFACQILLFIYHKL